MFRRGFSLWKPKNPHSLDYLKYLHGVLCKNQVVSESNRSLLVETLRSITEILIWGDQNDSTVIDFFLEKGLLAFFLRYMTQPDGRFICVQLLQTLNILFENISNETSIYYLLSNNHVNSIISHEFDFSDEEVMAYYISFVKTLSLRLNKHTIHFFFNEQTAEFALYIHSLKFFNHPESMVRIAVRTITLNVYRVPDQPMGRFILDHTAHPYFSHLIYAIGCHVFELNACIKGHRQHENHGRLNDYIAEYLDHLAYINDILNLQIVPLNEVLCSHLLQRLISPLFLYSLVADSSRCPDYSDPNPRLTKPLAMYLLAQMFLLFHHPFASTLSRLFLTGDRSVFTAGQGQPSSADDTTPAVYGGLRCGFVKPSKSLSELAKSTLPSGNGPTASTTDLSTDSDEAGLFSLSALPADSEMVSAAEQRPSLVNVTDDDKLAGDGAVDAAASQQPAKPLPLFLQSVLNSVQIGADDQQALISLTLLYALLKNSHVDGKILVDRQPKSGETDDDEQAGSTAHFYNQQLVDHLCHIINEACQPESSVRLVALELAIILLRHVGFATPDEKRTDKEKNVRCVLSDRHIASIEAAKESSVRLLRSHFKADDMFLDVFEDEYYRSIGQLNVERLVMDATVLVAPVSTPMTGVQLWRRLPSGEAERGRCAMRAFFLLRALSLAVSGQPELELPIAGSVEPIEVNSNRDLNNADLIRCVLETDQDKRPGLFLVVGIGHMMLVQPSTKNGQMGWGVVRYSFLLQDTELTGDTADSRTLHVHVRRTFSSAGGSASNSPASVRKLSIGGSTGGSPLFSGKLVFDDHIRCMAARQRLEKGRQHIRQAKHERVARLLDLPAGLLDSSQPELRRSCTPVDQAKLLKRARKNRAKASLDDGSKQSPLNSQLESVWYAQLSPERPQENERNSDSEPQNANRKKRHTPVGDDEAKTAVDEAKAAVNEVKAAVDDKTSSMKELSLADSPDVEQETEDAEAGVADELVDEQNQTGSRAEVTKVNQPADKEDRRKSPAPAAVWAAAGDRLANFLLRRNLAHKLQNPVSTTATSHLRPQSESEMNRPVPTEEKCENETGGPTTTGQQSRSLVAVGALKVRAQGARLSDSLPCLLAAEIDGLVPQHSTSPFV